MSNELPPLWALDMAAKAAGLIDWGDAYSRMGGASAIIASIIAHARTLADNPERYKPVDPADEQRWKDAREAAGTTLERDGQYTTLAAVRAEKGDHLMIVQSAYIMACMKDGVTPNLGEKK